VCGRVVRAREIRNITDIVFFFIIIFIKILCKHFCNRFIDRIINSCIFYIKNREIIKLK